ncbi:Uncharacterized protein dnm_069150 [Desulfonema magnum]|uniref:Uncharacterized protein n=1 Tax=Desulfonema magnum TaxID=45655 RepID=A0A975GS96_9BACT|nr:Uncharacterized protein dnm_069150 [Desulfonema magnum]
MKICGSTLLNHGLPLITRISLIKKICAIRVIPENQWFRQAPLNHGLPLITRISLIEKNPCHPSHP